MNKQLTNLRLLYNTALEHRIWAYKTYETYISYQDQQNELPLIKKDFPEFNETHSHVLQDSLRRLDKAFQGFFRRVKMGEKPGFPRFKGCNSIASICYAQSGYKLTGKRIKLSKIGCVKIKQHRPLPNNIAIKTCTISKEGSQWYCCICFEIAGTVKKKVVKNAVGIDMGLEKFITMSNGLSVPNPRYYQKSVSDLAYFQQQFSKNKGVKWRKKINRIHAKITNQRKDFLHKTSSELVRQYDIIAYEDLSIKKMTQGRFAKSIHDASWGKFIEMIKYKAESAGIYAIAVNPRNTSKICSGCGTIVEKKISDRQHDCPVCNLSLHRDLNASINILRSGVGLLKNNEIAFN